MYVFKPYKYYPKKRGGIKSYLNFMIAIYQSYGKFGDFYRKQRQLTGHSVA
jgi:hypothetical protein